MQQKNKLAIGIILLINLITSVSVTFAQSSTGSVTVNPCPTDCLALSGPNSIAAANSPLFFNNEESRIYLYSNYNLGEQVVVTDTNEDAQFSLDVNISDLVNSSNNSIIIPLADIGILTFNNSSTGSVDGYNADGLGLPSSSLDPVVRGETTEPFSQTELLAMINGSSNFDSYYTPFSGAGPTSSALNIITANNESSYLGRYNFGIGLIITLPDNAINDLSLIDGVYEGSLTFSLSEI